MRISNSSGLARPQVAAILPGAVLLFLWPSLSKYFIVLMISVILLANTLPPSSFAFVISRSIPISTAETGWFLIASSASLVALQITFKSLQYTVKIASQYLDLCNLTLDLNGILLALVIGLILVIDKDLVHMQTVQYYLPENSHF